MYVYLCILNIEFHICLCRLTGKQLWKYAIDAILSDIQQKNWRRSPKFVLTRAHQNVQYVQGYVQYLTKSAVSKEVKVSSATPS